MKKALIGVAVLAAVGTGYLYQQQVSQNESSAVQFNIAALNYVPADTVLFNGQLQPFPVKQYIKQFANNPASYQQFNDITEDLTQGEHAAQRFFGSLLATYTETIKNPDLLQQNFGVADSYRSVFYTLGLLPVIRFELVDESAFWRMLDKAADSADLSAEQVSYQSHSYKRYPLYEMQGKQFDLVASVKDGWATVSFNTPFNDQNQLLQALALEVPKSSLAQQATLNDMVQTHQLDGAYVGFLNHVALVNGITNHGNSDFNQMLNKMLSFMSAQDELAQVRTEACQQDFNQMIKQWPRTVFGSRKLAISEQGVDIDAAMIVENNNLDLMKVLMSLRGFIPKHLQQDQQQIASFGLGLDVSKVTPVLTTLWNNFTQATYQCEPVVELQRQVAQNSPMMTAMVTGMASDVKGLGLSLLDFELSTAQGYPELAALDSLVSLSVNNPVGFFNSFKAFYPPLADVELKADGTAISLIDYAPMLKEFSVSPMLAAKGQHLVLYHGHKSQQVAESLVDQTLTNNGVQNFNIDYKKFFTPMFAAAKAAGETVPQELLSLSETDMKVQFSMDYTAQGIEFVSKLQTSN